MEMENNKKNFSLYFDQKIYPELKDLEKIRREVWVSYLKWFLIAFGGLGGVVWYYFDALKGYIPWETAVLICALVVFIVSALLSSVFGRSRYRYYVEEFKNRVIRQVIDFFGYNLLYAADSGVSEHMFQASGIFNVSLDVFKHEDGITGTVGQTQVSLSELCVKDVRGYGRNRRYVEIFNGLFIVADFHKHFKGKTFVLTDHAERVFGFIGKMFQEMNFSRPPLVCLGDPSFEKEFVVHSTDQQEAHYILTPDMMKRMVRLKQSVKAPVQFSFVDSSIYIAIPQAKNMFEPKLFGTSHPRMQVYEYYTDLKRVFQVIEDLNLNTRIWSKAVMSKER